MPYTYTYSTEGLSHMADASTEKGSLLVVGAQALSLGWHVARAARMQGWSVTTAGISDDEDIYRLDITVPMHRHNLLRNGLRFDAIVCTTGINLDGSVRSDVTWDYDIEKQLTTNAAGPLGLLREWIVSMEAQGASLHGRSFVAVSSNSAHIPRSRSAGYCASKAALSMGLRCVAREMADSGMNIWGVEPGWLRDTPMSKRVEERLGDAAPHRIPDNRTVKPEWLAELIVTGIDTLGRSSLNGCMIRIDGGEL